MLDHPCFRAAAASLLSLKAEGATLEVVTSVKKQSGPGIVEVSTVQFLFLFLNFQQVGLGIGDEDRLGEAVSAFTSVQEPKVGFWIATVLPYPSFPGRGSQRGCGVGPRAGQGGLCCLGRFFPHSLLKEFDMILVISDSCTVVKEGVKEELIKYRLKICHNKVLAAIFKIQEGGGKGEVCLQRAGVQVHGPGPVARGS